ncbi:LytTR family DNA-binding domain-containing protein [Atopobium fossor]|uniref:LytTR family DNA-binding domain-containing protein n=1 Tax=Atopobium fossor TaxID=39487 RepID=UPI000411D744|nr:LytTR family DNA-binding domain-containing protein [Atopobium fossor]
MRIFIDEKRGFEGIEVHLVVDPDNPRLPRLLELLRVSEGKFIAYEGSGTVRKVLPFAQVAFIEAHEPGALIHCMDGRVFESAQRLFALENALGGTEFIRISKQLIVNFDAVVGIRPELNGRMVLELQGDTTVLVSRTYASVIKQKLASWK